MSKAIRLLICITPISASACFEFDLLFRSFFMVSVSSNALPNGRTSNLQASCILKTGTGKIEENLDMLNFYTKKANAVRKRISKA